jgi:hypothetical protein
MERQEQQEQGHTSIAPSESQVDDDDPMFPLPDLDTDLSEGSLDIDDHDGRGT